MKFTEIIIRTILVFYWLGKLGEVFVRAFIITALYIIINIQSKTPYIVSLILAFWCAIPLFKIVIKDLGGLKLKEKS